MARLRSGAGLEGPGVAAAAFELVGGAEWPPAADVNIVWDTEEGVTAEVLLFVPVLPFDDGGRLLLALTVLLSLSGIPPPFPP